MALAHPRFCGRLLLLGLGLFFICWSEAYSKLSDSTLKALPRPKKDFDIHNGAILAPILQPRVPGTPGHAVVLEHLANFFRASLPKWTLEFQNSTSKTPVSQGKDVPFINLIAYRDPPGARIGDVGRLTLVAHYDSKYEPEGFIGGIDSAAPCAMILHAMRSIDEALDKKWTAMKQHGADSLLEEQQGIQVLLLDGEEAFKEWTDTDSLYGARSLAADWDHQMYPAMSTFKTPLASMSLFVLLDLLGAKAPSIRSYYQTTHWAYQSLGTLEQRFRSLGLWRSDSKKTWFPDALKESNQIFSIGGIEDDHLPFLARGVEILHLIDFDPRKGFPAVWHTIDDDAEHLDMNTVEDWSVLIAAFAAEWMDLEEYLMTPEGVASRQDNEPVDEANLLTRKTEL